MLLCDWSEVGRQRGKQVRWAYPRLVVIRVEAWLVDLVEVGLLVHWPVFVQADHLCRKGRVAGGARHRLGVECGCAVRRTSHVRRAHPVALTCEEPREIREFDAQVACQYRNLGRRKSGPFVQCLHNHSTERRLQPGQRTQLVHGDCQQRARFNRSHGGGSQLPQDRGDLANHRTWTKLGKLDSFVGPVEIRAVDPQFARQNDVQGSGRITELTQELTGGERAHARLRLWRTTAVRLHLAHREHRPFAARHELPIPI